MAGSPAEAEDTSSEASRQIEANERARVFQSHRPRLFRLAYRMLGSRADAEDLVQDTYLRWHGSATEAVVSPAAFLITVATRLCLDRLRERKQQCECSLESLPCESVVDDACPSPEEWLELAGEVSFALVAVHERLGPEERMAFLMHEVLDYDYPEVAQMLNKAEAACRQMIHRARTRVREPRSRFAVSAQLRERMLGKFLAAMETDDRRAIVAVLAESSESTA